MGDLLGWPRSSSLSPYQIFQLFATCRRVLQTLTAASSQEKVNGTENPLTCKLLKCPFPLLWILKSFSVVIAFLCTFPEQIDLEAKMDMFSLLDHTSNLLLMITRDKFKLRIKYLVSAGNASSQSVSELAEALQHIHKSLADVKDTYLGKAEFMGTVRDLNKISMVIACFNGLLWGLASTLGDLSMPNSDFRLKFSNCDIDLISQINSCVDTFMTSVTFVLKSLFLKDDSSVAEERHTDGKVGLSDVKECKKGSVNKEPCSAIPDFEIFLSEVQHKEFYLKKSLTLEVLSGENAEAAIFLRQVFIACSAILRLNLQILTCSSQTMLAVVVVISQFLLLEFTRSEMPLQFGHSCLEGAAKFLEQLGNYFPQFDPSKSREFYTWLIGLHLKVIGKCISLLGKNAKLTSKDASSPAKHSDIRSGSTQLNGLLERLRMSFKTYIKKSSTLHLHSAIQAVERALVGVQEGFTSNYDIVCGNLDGGEVSSISAAGIDALDLILEHVTGDLPFIFHTTFYS